MLNTATGTRTSWRALMLGGASLVAVALTVTPVQAKIPHGGGADTDLAIADAIQDDFAFDPLVPEGIVDVAVEDGDVTLTGTVANLDAKRRAERIAGLVRGVDEIDNQLTVSGGGASAPEELAARVSRALLADLVTNGWEIDVSADATGKVVLSGEVDTHYEKRTAGEVVSSVVGVTALDNTLTVNTVERDAEVIQAEILSGLYNDATVDASDVRVAVDGAQVTLTGSVNSRAAYNDAVAHAFVPGVSSVDANGLTVDGFEVETRLATEAGAAQDPAEVITALRAALAADPRVDDGNITVQMDGATAFLRGTQDTLAAKSAATGIALRQSGVSSVQNRIRIPAPAEPDAEAITAAIQDAYDRDAVVNAKDLTVSYADGLATLDGQVATFDQRVRAEALAQQIGGVQQVANLIQVKDGTQRSFYDPYIRSRFEIGDVPQVIVPQSPVADENELRDEVEDNLFWSRAVDEDRIEVTVDGGTAVLRGEVASAAAKRVAVKEAYEAGATTVIDRLEIARRIEG